MEANHRDNDPEADNKPNIPYSSIKLQHDLKLASSYAKFQKEPEYTLKTNTLVKTVDFIFYQSHNFNVYDACYFTTPNPIPDNTWPSDHLPIIASFAMK